MYKSTYIIDTNSRIFASQNLQNDVHKTCTPNQPAVAVLRPGVAAEPEAYWPTRLTGMSLMGLTRDTTSPII